MPTILRVGGYRFFFYSNEGEEPPHIHVEYQGAVSKFWLMPVRIAYNDGMKSAVLSKAAWLVKKHEKILYKSWSNYFGERR